MRSCSCALARRPRRRAHQRAGRRRLQRPPRRPGGDVRLPGVRGRPRDPAGPAGRREGVAARPRARPSCSGPMDFTMNDESGVLVEGFDREPMIKQPWHPPYYQRALRGGRASRRQVDLLMWELDISDREKLLPVLFELAEQARARARRHDPQDVAALAAQGHGPLRRGLQRGLGAQLGLRALLRRPTSTSYAQELQLVFDAPWFMVAETGRRDRRDRDHRPRRQPGAQADERAPAALRLVDVPAQEARSSTAAASASSGVKPEYQHTGVAAALYVEHFDARQRRPRHVGRDGLDPRDQPRR